MRIAVARETREGETRVALVPELIGKLTGLGAEVLVEPDAGRGAQISDEEFAEAGATIDAGALGEADVVVSVQPLAAGRRTTAAPRDGNVLVPPGRAGARPGRHDA